ncbi:hypothetical protein RJ639_039599 [Escallonia herrerae]|uniref:PHD-type domain-containing protein n=1 Tax=Escallonia herrerae TaxID=1293975 RepID=A0AA88WK86_9ASTE|nr:hypothetical protein RJ639_039599 [Escallonia herrerae]
MRLSRYASVSRRSDERLVSSRTKKKHKRLDAICESVYNRNHGGLGGAESSECNIAGHESELRRSTRVRRPPVVLDASPLRPKKRRKVDSRSGVGSLESSGRRGWVKGDSLSPSLTPRSTPTPSSRDLEEESDGWRSRLRNRTRNVTSSPRGKRKLFDDLDGMKEESKSEVKELDGKFEGVEGGKATVVMSKRPGRVKASNVLTNEHQDIGMGSVKEDEKEKNDAAVLEGRHLDCLLEVECGDKGELSNGNAVTVLLEEKEGESNKKLQLEECNVNDNVDPVEEVKQVKKPGSAKDGENQGDAVEVGGDPIGCTEDGVHLDLPLEGENIKKVDKWNFTSTDAVCKPRIKGGRRCGLCGGGTDGKPPKELVHNWGGSDNEAYSGSSSSEEPNYDKWDGFDDEPGWLGRLLGPINDRYGIAGIWVHQHCAVWSPEVYFAGLGCLKNVRAALCRGRVLKCSRCGRPGATIGCRVDRCPKTYHLPCARAKGCIFDHRKFLIACTDHRHLFQPQGSKFFSRLKKLKAKKMKLELRKISNDAWRKDHEAEEKWLENCGEDEEFIKRESKRLHRDLLRIAPIYIGGSKSRGEIEFQGWESVAGLQDVIQCLKEVVILPLLYPEFLNNLGLTPPRGVLLHGYPGTGKTLVVRALIGSCARGDKRIAYFARKGADCLGKYVGDAERQLRLLFQVAEKSQPSVIFFDEIDGLAPCRSRQQDQTHSSVVSTLLALMDGLKSRGSVVVIGATNRPDAVDPALRRPGRFDREIYFPLPSAKDREAILSLHTQNWPKPITGSLLKWIAGRTVGFAGADLQALCTQASMIALKRSCPLQKLLSASGEKGLHGKRSPLPTFTVVERDWLEALSCAPPPCSRREAGMAANDVVCSPLPAHLVCCLLQPLSRLLVSFYLDERVWLPPPLSRAATMIKTITVSALDMKKVRSDDWLSHVHDLLQDVDVASEIGMNLSEVSNLVGDVSFSSFDAFGDDTVDGSPEQHRVTRTGLLQNVSYASGKKLGFRVLISGNPRTGQRHLASCILHCFFGNVEMQKVDLATITQEGRGDVVQGLTHVLRRCASAGSCLVFMPRLDLWAVETCEPVDNEESPSLNLELSEENNPCLTENGVVDIDNRCPGICESTERKKPGEADRKVSQLWNLFMEQVGSICVSTPLMVLATSDLPFAVLPPGIRHFFSSDMLNPYTRLEDTVPRFSIQVDGKFNRDMVIDSSAAKLSKDVAQHFIQLIHQSSHTREISCEEDKACDTLEDDSNTVCHNLGPVSPIQHVMEKKFPISPDAWVSSPLNKRNMKGRSSLLVAISTFGYQILLYPHFAEICWVTSKLKEGPIADINGPWKGWPFNSCIVRPKDKVEQVVLTYNSSTVKSKEHYGLVRGLIAVGLSAYRGVYASLREVSVEVRKVLELLAEQINAKIQAGKDRYMFTDLLSQVAYLEDMVNSWAYTLQSLEVDAQLSELKSMPTCARSLVTYKDNVECEECKPHCPNKGLHDSEVQEESLQEGDAVRFINLKEGDCKISHPSLGGRSAVVEKGPSEHLVLRHSPTAKNIQIPAATDGDDWLDGKLLDKQIGLNHEPHGLDSFGTCAEVSGDFGLSKLSNGFSCMDTVVPPEDGPCGSGDMGGVNSCDAGKGCKQNQNNGLPLSDINTLNEDGNATYGSTEDISLIPSRNMGLQSNSDDLCLYSCCSVCVNNLHLLMQKVIIYEWGLQGSNRTVEDIHDMVTTLSVNLHSAVRKFCPAGNSINSFDKDIKHDSYRKLFEGRELGMCQCKDTENSLVMPTECSCHTRSDSVTAKANSQNPRQGRDLKLLFRGGVLTFVDHDDVSFHCKFETLCLCPLIEWMVMTKQPLD